MKSMVFFLPENKNSNISYILLNDYDIYRQLYYLHKKINHVQLEHLLLYEKFEKKNKKKETRFIQVVLDKNSPAISL